MCVYCDLTRVVCVDEKKIDGIRRIVLIILIRITKLKFFNLRLLDLGTNYKSTLFIVHNLKKNYFKKSTIKNNEYFF